MGRVQVTKMILWSLTGLAAAVGVVRFIVGLGATTNLSDATPWGIWVGFDVMAGVALASGGFVMTAIFYMMRREEYHTLVRPAVLTAFLGYLAVIFGLLFDLGLPWNIWHMMIYWNPHSPLFEVGWCVMLYTTVLLLEFSPVPLEETSRYAKIRSFLMKFRFPLVLLGIMLSTLHQSSLGSLFLIMPFKLHPLWYTDILPVLFFISAASLGLMMVALESLASHWLYRRESNLERIGGLARIAAGVLAVYLIVRLGELIWAGEFGLIFAGTWESGLFIAELLISAIIPLILFVIPSVRRTRQGLWIGSSMVVAGMIFNRINVGGLTMLRATGDTYIPSWTEISISLGVVSAAALAFMFGVEKLHIWDKRAVHPESKPSGAPVFDHTSEVWLGAPPVAARTKYSLAFVLCFAIGIALIPFDDLHSRGVEQLVVQKARGGDVIFIDGNRDTYGVSFKHAMHVEKSGVECAGCHHMNKPMDKETGCYECHRSMYTATDVFGHNWHASPAGGNIRCRRCHTSGTERHAETAVTCDQCHTDLYPKGATIKVDSRMAPSYTDAMHGLCLACHNLKAAQSADLAKLDQCATCHSSSPSEYYNDAAKDLFNRPYFNHVVMPMPAQPSSEGI